MGDIMEMMLTIYEHGVPLLFSLWGSGLLDYYISGLVEIYNFYSMGVNRSV